METNTVLKFINWEESAFSEVANGGKLTKASVEKEYSGELEGRGIVEYLMTYTENGSSSFYGFERFIGRVGENTGTFIFQHSGVFEEGQVTETSIVLADSATDSLIGLSGKINFNATQQEEYPVCFEYSF